MIKKIFNLILFIALLAHFVFAEPYFEVNLYYNNGTITNAPVQVKYTDKELDNLIGGYVAQIVSFENETLNLTFFDIPNLIIYDNFDKKTGEAISGGIIELTKQEILLQLPYYENAKEINIYDKNIQKKLTISVSEFARDRFNDETGIAVANVNQKPEATIQTEQVVNSKKKLVITFLAIFVVMGIIVWRLKSRRQKS
jgi:hypothetical protein